MPIDPAPRLEALDVGLLGLQAFGVVLPLPDVVDVALALALHERGELHEDGHPPRIGEAVQLLAIEVRAVGMHDHARLLVLDPEVVLALRAIAQLFDEPGSGTLRLVTCQSAGLLVTLEGGQDAPGGIGELPDRLSLALHERLLEGGQDEAPEGGQEEEHGGQRRDDDAQHERATLEAMRRTGRDGRGRHGDRGPGGRGGVTGERVSGEQGRAEAQPVLARHVDAGQAASQAVAAVEVGARADEQPVPLCQLAEGLPVVLRELLVDGLQAIEPHGLEAHHEVLEPRGVRLVDERMCQEGAPTGRVEERDGVRRGQAAGGGRADRGA